MIDGQEAVSVTSHVGHCERCTRRLAVMRGTTVSVSTAMSLLAQDDGRVDPLAAHNRFRVSLAQQRAEPYFEAGGSGVSQIFARRGSRATIGVVAAVALLLTITFSPMRTVANDFLDQFRVQKFAAVTIPMDFAAPLQSGILDNASAADTQQMHDSLSGLGTFETTFNFDKDHMPSAVTLDQAAASYSGLEAPSNLPDGFTSDPQAYVTEAGTASYTMNVAKVRDLIHQLNLPIYAFDNVQSETLTFGVDVPAAAILRYQDTTGQNLFVGQMESPTLSIDKNFDMNALRDEILRFPALPADLVGQLRSIKDWEHTLIVPIPEGATSENVTIDGQPGLLIKADMGNAVLWQKDGKLYAVAGQVSADSVLATAKSLQASN
jgi:hypothetical protein